MKILLYGHDLNDLANILWEDLRVFVGDEYSVEENDSCESCAKDFLESDGKTLVIYEDGKAGIRMSAWIA